MANVTFAQCVVVDGVAYATVAAAQTAILTKLFEHPGTGALTPTGMAEKILAERETVLAALNLEEPPKPKGRPKGSRNKAKHAEIPGIQPKAA